MRGLPVRPCQARRSLWLRPFMITPCGRKGKKKTNIKMCACHDKPTKNAYFEICECGHKTGQRTENPCVLTRVRSFNRHCAYHFKKDRFPTHRQPLNRSFLKRFPRKKSANSRSYPKIWPPPDLTKTNTTKCHWPQRCERWPQRLFDINARYGYL